MSWYDWNKYTQKCTLSNNQTEETTATNNIHAPENDTLVWSDAPFSNNIISRLLAVFQDC